MRILYSTGARFAGGGIGTTAYHAVRGYWRCRHLHHLICGSYRKTEVPAELVTELGLPSRIWRKLAVYDRTQFLDHAYRVAFDHWVAHQLSYVPALHTGDVLHAWSGYHLRTLGRASRLGLLTVLDRALAHPLSVDQMLNAEYRKWGLPPRRSPTAGRISREIEEADAVLIPSKFVYRSFIEQGVNTGKLIQIPFGVDAEKFFPAPERRAGDRFRALFMGQVSVRKGAPYLLDAWKRLRWRDAELWLAGRVDLPRELREKYSDLRGVRFLGHVADPVSIFQQADVFVFPSLAEGSALVNYEAMACGLPVVTTFNAGSIARHDQEGIIIPARSVEALATALERLRADHRLRNDMGMAARARAEEHSWERYGHELDSAMQQLLNARN